MSLMIYASLIYNIFQIHSLQKRRKRSLELIKEDGALEQREKLDTFISMYSGTSHNKRSGLGEPLTAGGLPLSACPG